MPQDADDWAVRGRGMSNVRTFVAIELPPEVVDKLLHLQESLRGCGARVRWARPDGMHLTVKFLGDVEFEKAGEISAVLKEAVADIEPFRVNVRGAGTFPKGGGAPRVVWAGVEGGEESLQKIYKRLNERLSRFGVRYEKRRFSPHITVGRVKSPAGAGRLVQLVRDQADKVFGEVEIEELVFFMSELTGEGPVYTVLARIPFGPGSTRGA